MSRARGFAFGFGACLAASFGAIWVVGEIQAHPRPTGPVVLHVLLVEPNARADAGVRLDLDGHVGFIQSAASFGSGGGTDEIGPWSAAPGAATLRATTPNATVERVLDLAPGTCRVVAIRTGGSVHLTPCLAPVARR